MKMALLVIGLMLVILLIVGIIFTHFLGGVLEEEIGQKALMVAESVSLIPELKTELLRGDPLGKIQVIAEDIRVKTCAEFVVVGDREGRRYSHPDPEKLGELMVGGDNWQALEEGEFYISKAVGTLGPSIRGKAPILSPSGEVIGVVSVGYLLRDVNSIIQQAQLDVLPLLPVMFLIGIAGSVWIAGTFKKAIFGLEPHEITKILQERTAILESIRSGIVATDDQLKITLINHAAIKSLELTGAEEAIGQAVDTILPHVPIQEVLLTGEKRFDREYQVDDVKMVFNLIPIIQDHKFTGVLATFRRKDEIDILTRELSSAKQYADILRAQTHEYANKLHTIAGLIQLESYADALELIVREDNHFKEFVSKVTRLSNNPVISALILGKFSYAQEMKVAFILDPRSRLTSVGEDFPSEKLVTIIGNLLDNAFEATREASQADGWVKLLLNDADEKLTIRVEDSGRGVPDEITDRLFQRGVSSKKKSGRGVGLYLVAKCLEELEGEITLERGPAGGAVFNVAIPLTART